MNRSQNKRLIDPAKIHWSERERFKAELTGSPYRIRGLFPDSFDMSARTDIVIALIREGFIEFRDEWSSGAKVLRPFCISPGNGYLVGSTIRFSWVDWGRIDEAVKKL